MFKMLINPFDKTNLSVFFNFLARVNELISPVHRCAVKIRQTTHQNVFESEKTYYFSSSHSDQFSTLSAAMAFDNQSSIKRATSPVLRFFKKLQEKNNTNIAIFCFFVQHFSVFPTIIP